MGHDPDVRRTVIATALAAEALAIVGWWLVLATAPAIRARFHPPGTPSSTVTSFVVAEAALVLALAVAAVGVWRQRAWAQPARWAAAGAMTYAALFCVGQWLVTGGAALAMIARLDAILGEVAATVEAGLRGPDAARDVEFDAADRDRLLATPPRAVLAQLAPVALAALSPP